MKTNTNIAKLANEGKFKLTDILTIQILRANPTKPVEFKDGKTFFNLPVKVKMTSGRVKDAVWEAYIASNPQEKTKSPISVYYPRWQVKDNSNFHETRLKACQKNMAIFHKSGKPEAFYYCKEEGDRYVNRRCSVAKLTKPTPQDGQKMMEKYEKTLEKVKAMMLEPKMMDKMKKEAGEDGEYSQEMLKNLQPSPNL